MKDETEQELIGKACTIASDAFEDLVPMIKRGEIDIATLIQDLFFQRVKDDPGLRLLNPVSSANWIVHMASQWDPKSPWSDPRVRKAASLAIDRKTLREKLKRYLIS